MTGKPRDAAQTNGYAEHAAFYARVAQNHPSVVAYATSHNATGYFEVMNPDLIDGVYAPPPDQQRENCARRSRRSSASWTPPASFITTLRATWA